METSYNPTDAIQTIEQSIKEISALPTGAAYYFKLWGLILSSFYAIQFIAQQTGSATWNLIQNFSWLLFVIGGIASGVQNKHDQQTEQFEHFLDRVYFYAFISFAISVAVIQLYASLKNNQLNYTLFPLLLGMTIICTGGIAKYYLSVALGVICCALSVVNLFVAVEFVALIAAIAAFIGSFLTGYFMKNRNV
jgi:hypothetical protein